MGNCGRLPQKVSERDRILRQIIRQTYFGELIRVSTSILPFLRLKYPRRWFKILFLLFWPMQNNVSDHQKVLCPQYLVQTSKIYKFNIRLCQSPMKRTKRPGEWLFRLATDVLLICWEIWISFPASTKVLAIPLIVPPMGYKISLYPALQA